MADNTGVTTFVKPVEKLIDAVQAAVGKLYEPTYVRKMADAKAYEIQKIGEATREYCDIPITYKDGTVAIETVDIDEFVKRTQHRMAYQELTKQANIESVVGKTYKILENESPVTDEPVSNDFLNYFFNCVQDVSAEEMQTLWARILAGEVKQPSTFSVRTLSTLHNMSKTEAEKFQQMLPYVIRFDDGAFLPNYSQLLNSVGITYADILDAEEWGLINSFPSLQTKIRFSVNDGIVCRNKTFMITMQSEQNGKEELHVPQYPLTVAGREIAMLANVEEDNDFFIRFGKTLKKQIKNHDSSTVLHMYRIVNPEDIPRDEMPIDESNGTRPSLFYENEVDYLAE